EEMQASSGWQAQNPAEKKSNKIKYRMCCHKVINKTGLRKPTADEIVLFLRFFRIRPLHKARKPGKQGTVRPYIMSSIITISRQFFPWQPGFIRNDGQPIFISGKETACEENQIVKPHRNFTEKREETVL
ncbi:MAG: hypothetical protein KY428_01315, partial [Bacteroidetes bacterium]|nr:hypothetical protein [Bacteroidota bacterium]